MLAVQPDSRVQFSDFRTIMCVVAAADGVVPPPLPGFVRKIVGNGWAVDAEVYRSIGGVSHVVGR